MNALEPTYAGLDDVGEGALRLVLLLLPLVHVAVAVGIAVAVWKLFRVGRPGPTGRRVASFTAFVLVTGTIYLVAFATLWSWGSGS